MKINLINREEEILKNIVNLTNISSKSGNEILKARYLQELMFEYGIKNVIIDPAGNVVAKIKGKNEENAIVINAHMDTLLENKNVKITLKSITGEGVGDNSLGVYSLALIGDLLRDEELENTIYLVGTTEGETSLKGVKYFLDNCNETIKGFINLEGFNKGRINTVAVALNRLKIEFEGEGGHLWKDFGGTNPIYGISNFVHRIREEDFGKEIVFNIGEVNSGIFYNLIPSYGYLKMEIRGLDILEVKKVTEIVKNISIGVAKEEKLKVNINQEFSRNGACISNSKLEKIFLSINKRLNIRTVTGATNTEIILPLTRGIDSVTVGVAKGGNRYQENEYIEIKSIYKGIEQIFDAILEFDKV